MDLKREPTILAYIAAFFGVLLATVVTLHLRPLIQIHNMSLFMLTVVGVAWFGGLWPSLFAIALSAGCFAYFIAPPQGWAIGSPEDWLRLSTFTCISVIVCSLLAALGGARAKVQSLVQ